MLRCACHLALISCNTDSVRLGTVIFLVLPSAPESGVSWFLFTIAELIFLYHYIQCPLPRLIVLKNSVESANLSPLILIHPCHIGAHPDSQWWCSWDILLQGGSTWLASDAGLGMPLLTGLLVRPIAAAEYTAGTCRTGHSLVTRTPRSRSHHHSCWHEEHP